MPLRHGPNNAAAIITAGLARWSHACTSLSAREART
jgi:hypothetical protein